jgi:chromosome segregation ATPase
MADNDAPVHELGGDVSDVTHSTAFLSIDALLEEGKLVEERAAHLKSKFKELHDRVLQIYNHDNFLLKRARQARKDLEVEKAKVDKCGQVARLDDEAIQQLKKELAAAEHELSISQEKESMLQVEALELDRKRQNLTHEVEDAIKAEESRLRPQIEALHKSIKEIGEQIDATSKEFDSLREHREKLLAKETGLKEEMEKTEMITQEAKTEYNRMEKEPERAKKQADIVLKAHLTAQKEISSLDEKINNQLDMLNRLEVQRRQKHDEQCDMVAALQNNRNEIDAKLKTLGTINSSLEVETETRTNCQQRVTELEAMIKAAAIAFNTERDKLARTIRDKETGMKNFKAAEQAKADIESEKDLCHKQVDFLNREAQRLNQQRKQYNHELEELKRDVDILINNFLKEEISEKRCVKDKEEAQEAIRALEDQVADRNVQEQAQKRELAELSMKREQVSRESSRNHGRVLLAKNELKVKEVVLRELKKRHEELESRLAALMNLFQAVKRERSQKAAQIQSASQRMSEMQEKTKILENELEVLRRESLIKDTELTKKKRESHELRQSCKNLRVDKNKCRKKLDEAANVERDLKNQMRKLNTAITHTEDEMLELKRDYEEAVEQRNYTGIQLIDRNDELCILYEKSNIQEAILKNGMVAINQRMEEIRGLSIRLTDLQRQIELCQRVLPQVRDMEEDLAKLLQELEDERWRAEVLENDLTDPLNANRWRMLDKPKKDGGKGGDAAAGATAGAAGANQEGPSEEFVQLQKKHQELEQRVSTLNERLMEKDLILEEVTELSQKLRKQAANGRDFTLALAKKVNTYQHSIKNKTKRMMATLSELSMVQASSIQLQMDVQQLEETVQQARERLAQGDAPTDDVEMRIRKDEENRLRQSQMAEERRAAGAAPGGDGQDYGSGQGTVIRTTAEQRPNAYVPDGDLGLPKPYGKHAPFKPTLSVQGNVSRFYRKTETKELDFDA